MDGIAARPGILKGTHPEYMRTPLFFFIIMISIVSLLLFLFPIPSDGSRRRNGRGKEKEKEKEKEKPGGMQCMQATCILRGGGKGLSL